MRGRRLFWGAVSAGAAYALLCGARQTPGVGRDVARYDRIRSMSGEPPFLLELPIVIARVLGAAAPSHPIGLARDLIRLPASLANDLRRYVMMSRM